MPAEKDAITHLLDIMDDEAAKPRDRLNAAVSASRCERLELVPGEPAPASVQYLRALLDDPSVVTNHRREAAAAVAYFERRSKKAALNFDVADTVERRNIWRKLINSGIRHHLSLHKRWPADRHILIPPNDTTFDMPPGDPDHALSALLLGPANRHERRRQKAIDQPIAGRWLGSEEERREVLQPVAQAVHERLKAFNLASEMGSSMVQPQRLH